jgi:hypothetical protein
MHIKNTTLISLKYQFERHIYWNQELALLQARSITVPTLPLGARMLGLRHLYGAFSYPLPGSSWRGCSRQGGEDHATQFTTLLGRGKLRKETPLR